MTLNKKDMTILWGAVGVLVLFGLASLAYFYANDLKRLRAEKEAEAAKLAQVQAKVDDLSLLETKLMDVEALLEGFDRLVPAKKELPQLLRDMANILTRAGVDLREFSPDPTASPVQAVPEFSQMVITVQTKGTYEQTKRMFADLRSWRRLIGIKDFSLKSESAKDSNYSEADPLLVCDFHVVVFFAERTAPPAGQGAK